MVTKANGGDPGLQTIPGSPSVDEDVKAIVPNGQTTTTSTADQASHESHAKTEAQDNSISSF